MRANRTIFFGMIWLISACQPSDQSAPVKITVGPNKMNIPAECFDAPVVYGGRKERVSRASILFVFLLPDLQCKNPSNYSEILRPQGDDGPRIEVLAGIYGPAVDASKVADEIFKIKAVERSVKDSLHIVGEDDGDSHWEFKDRDYYQIHDAWRSQLDSRSIDICSRTQRRHDVGPWVGQCEHFFTYHGLHWQLGYGARWSKRRHEIEVRMKHRIDRFIQDAGNQRQRFQRADSLPSSRHQ